MKNILKQPLKLVLCLASLVILIYCSLLIIRQVMPRSYAEKYMHCLELGSNTRTQACIGLLHGQIHYTKIQELLDSGDETSAQTYVDSLSEDEYRVYKAMKAQLK